MTSKTYKLFWVWQFEREASYIQAMAHQGKRLIKTNGFAYTFEDVAPMSGVVQIDYKKSEDLSAFKALLQDTGWEVLASKPQLNGAWLYCYNPDSTAKLYSDQQSKVELLQQLRTRWTIFGLSILALNLFILFNGYDPQDTWINWLLAIILIALFVLYVINFVILTRQIKYLKQ